MSDSISRIDLTEAGSDGRLWNIAIDGEPAPAGTTVQIPAGFSLVEGAGTESEVTLNNHSIPPGVEVRRNGQHFASSV